MRRFNRQRQTSLGIIICVLVELYELNYHIVQPDKRLQTCTVNLLSFQLADFCSLIKLFDKICRVLSALY